MNKRITNCAKSECKKWREQQTIVDGDAYVVVGNVVDNVEDAYVVLAIVTKLCLMLILWVCSGNFAWC